MNLSFKDRIAFHYMLATAGIVLLLFFAIYYVVKTSMYYRLDQALEYEALKHVKEVSMVNGEIRFHNKAEWEEREHREAEVHPVFIQVVDAQGKLCDKSPNLKEAFLPYSSDKEPYQHYNASFDNKRIRVVQLPLELGENRRATLVAAMSLEDAHMVLLSLKRTLLIAFPLVLLTLFFSSRLLAGRSIQPVISITNTLKKISKSNLSERIPLPEKKDELHELASAINDLLERLKQAFIREKQFTSDASHELRTPLSVIKGTFEVLLRKKRTPEEYIEKIEIGIKEIDRLNHTVEHLLTLARMETSESSLHPQPIELGALLEENLQSLHHPIYKKNIAVSLNGCLHCKVHTDKELLQLILYNLLSNAIKYSPEGGKIRLEIKDDQQHKWLTISDNGIGIDEKDLHKIFEPFYRSDLSRYAQIPGDGLGLSIVKKACDLLKIELLVESQNKKGTSFRLKIPSGREKRA